MPRSPRSQRLLLGGFALLLVVSGTAFASTFGSQVSWQQRDAVDARVVGYEVVDDDGTTAMRVRLAVDNPISRPVRVSGGEIVVYEGEEPFSDADQLTVARSLTVPETTVPAGGDRTVDALVEVDANRTDRARAAVAEGSATASGVLTVELVGREFDVGV